MNLSKYPTLYKLAAHDRVHVHVELGERCEVCDVNRELRALLADSKYPADVLRSGGRLAWGLWFVVIAEFIVGTHWHLLAPTIAAVITNGQVGFLEGADRGSGVPPAIQWRVRIVSMFFGAIAIASVALRMWVQ